VRVGSPLLSTSYTAFTVALPRARGFTPHRPVGHPRQHGSPTCAWVHPWSSCIATRSRWLSHVRVGSPVAYDNNDTGSAALPRARGFTRVALRPGSLARGSPTCTWESLPSSRALPRARGFTLVRSHAAAVPEGSPTCAWVHPRLLIGCDRLFRLSHVRVGSPSSRPAHRPPARTF
jgi:hypothetical protein